MAQSVVFLASSTEGAAVAGVVRDHLANTLGSAVVLKPWQREFDLSVTYIESLEKVAAEADFAVLVVTPDDVTVSRAHKKSSPRDNVVFELGLFMGALGRDRCLIVRDEGADLKLPSDLLGVHSASFRKAGNDELKASLVPACLAVGEHIAARSPRYKLTPDAARFQETLRQFCAALEGDWWERMTAKGINAISFFSIKSELISNSVVLSGQSFNEKGNPVAYWKSTSTRADEQEHKILYQWEGWHTVSELAGLPFHGVGFLEFDEPASPGERITRGKGRYWDVDEAHPQNTVLKPTQVRRAADADQAVTMKGGQEAIQALVQKVMKEW